MWRNTLRLSHTVECVWYEEDHGDAGTLEVAMRWGHDHEWEGVSVTVIGWTKSFGTRYRTVNFPLGDTTLYNVTKLDFARLSLS
jgi:hypothetical protein